MTSLIVTPGSANLILSIEDAGFNAFALFILDRLFVQSFTPRQYYLLFLVTGVAGNLLSLLGGSFLISFGASGGIFGLIGAAVSNNYAVTRKFNWSLVGWFVFVFFISTFISTNINVLAHVGGAVSGLVAGFFVGRSKRARY